MLRYLIVSAALTAMSAPAFAVCSDPGSGNSQHYDGSGQSCITDAPGAYANGSAALSTSPAQVFAASTGNPPRYRVKLLNNSGVGTSGGVSIVIWCRWGTVGGAPAAVAGVGSFALQPGGGIDDQGPGVNQSAVNCLAESGTPSIYAEQY